MTPSAKPSLLAQIFAPLAGFFLFLVGLTFLAIPMHGIPEPGLASILPMFMFPLPFTLGALGYLVVHRAFDRTASKDEPSPYRIATSPAHFLWCVLEPVVACTAMLSLYSRFNYFVSYSPLDAIMAFGTSIAPWLLFLTALGLIRKHPAQAIIGLLTAIAVPIMAR